MELKQIGSVAADEKGLFIQLEKEYRDALIGLEGFSHVHIIWWADKLDTPEMRANLVLEKPYKPAPEELGVFATRSPVRPNPICTTTISVAGVDVEAGIIRTWYIDAEPGTPVLDVKPYLPCSDRPEKSQVPEWSAMLPETIEESATFDWESYFNF
jgi:tRNA-Thr(GGU) m(6)t(6)A37 methyltransferase TsaA